MKLTLTFLTLSSLFPVAAFAQTADTQYEAVVLSDNVIVRSGPGRNHYSTGKLRPGDHVTVHRQERGGWLMIVPPQGSFDWVLADHVQLESKPLRGQPGRGVISVDRTVARIGSGVEAETLEFWHVMLTRGKRVSILGEQVINDSDLGPRLWYKIAPPAGDHRWVLGQFVQRVGEGAEKVDPFSPDFEDGNLTPPANDNPRGRRRAKELLTQEKKRANYDDTQAESQTGVKDRELVRTSPTPVVSTGSGSVQTGPSQEELADDRARIARLDNQFRSIIKRKTAQWDFAELKQEYQNLGDSAAHNDTRRGVNLRLRKLAQYQKIKDEHDQYVKLTKEAEDREASILSMQSKQEAAPKRRFSGAGIVQRSVGAPRGAPVHALVAPDGRVLAYLQAAPGVNLDHYLGRAVGVNGPRSHRTEWHTDHIFVEKLTPVRLKP